jgi:hypothetical protein
MGALLDFALLHRLTPGGSIVRDHATAMVTRTNRETYPDGSPVFGVVLSQLPAPAPFP